MDFVKFSLAGFDEFLVYAGLAIAYVYVFLIAYIKLTPYNELKLIKDGNVAAAISMSGALLGFTMPLAASIFQAAHPWDMMLWALIAGIVQLLVYAAVRYSLLNVSRRIPEGQVATGIVLGAVSLSAGILNAACMTY